MSNLDTRVSRAKAVFDGRCHCWQCMSLPNHEVFDSGMKCRGCSTCYLSICCYNQSRKCENCEPSPSLDVGSSFNDETNLGGLIFLF